METQRKKRRHTKTKETQNTQKKSHRKNGDIQKLTNRQKKTQKNGDRKHTKKESNFYFYKVSSQLGFSNACWSSSSCMNFHGFVWVALQLIEIIKKISTTS